MEELWRFIERLCEKVWQVSIGALVYMFNAIAPIHDILTACMIIFAANFFTGLFAGVLVQHEGFIFRKAFKCISEAAVISGLMAMILLVGDNNLNRIFPKNRYIDFLYYVLSFEMIKKIPYLENYKQKQKDK